MKAACLSGAFRDSSVARGSSLTEYEMVTTATSRARVAQVVALLVAFSLSTVSMSNIDVLGAARAKPSHAFG